MGRAAFRTQVHGDQLPPAPGSPRTVDFTDALPREPNGKLYKRLLRERYWAGHGSLVI